MSHTTKHGTCKATAFVDHDAELRFLKTACFSPESFKDRYAYKLYPDRLDWPWLISHVVRQGLAPLLWRRLKQRHPDSLALGVTTDRFSGTDEFWGIDKGLIQILRESYLSTLKRNFQVQAALEELDETLRGAVFPCMVWKGASLIQDVYPDLGLRPMDDIDILILKSDFEKAVRILKKLDYRPRPRYPLTWQREGVVIDLHFDAVHGDRIAARLGALPITSEALFHKSERLSGFQHLRTLSPKDKIICLAVHALKHDFSKAIWLIDAFYLLRHHPEIGIHPERLAARSEEFNARIVVYMFFSVFNTWHPHVVSELVESVRPKKIGPFSRFLIKRLGFEKQIPHLGEFFNLFLGDSILNKIGFILETLFPSRRVMRQIFPQQSALPYHFLYPMRIMRLVRLGLLTLKGITR
jgi:Uncharacterised nucleotidyltransferase